MIGEVRLLLDRRGVCRRFDVSISVLRRGGFQWTMERREHRQENCCLPPSGGVRTAPAYAERLWPWRRRHFGSFNTARLYVYRDYIEALTRSRVRGVIRSISGISLGYTAPRW